MRSVWLLTLVLLGRDAFEEGVRAFEEGRFADSLTHFQSVTPDLDAAPIALLHNRILAALAAGNLEDAERTSAQLARVAGSEWSAWLTFVRGNVAFARCERAAAIADQPEAEPFLFDAAIAAATEARDAWLTALAERGEWPQARRNLERALWKIRELKDKQEQARQPPDHPPPPPPPEPEPDEKPEQEPTDLTAQRQPLGPEEVAGLLERLQQKEQEKRALRRESRARRTQPGARDW